MQILGELAVPGTIAAVLMAGVRLVHIVLAYRLRCKEIELLGEQQPRIVLGSQPAKAAGARKPRRARRLR
ncbi:MAG TPA: hypothetical protein VFZ63_15105 [Jiangellaceae bacterium]